MDSYANLDKIIDKNISCSTNDGSIFEAKESREEIASMFTYASSKNEKPDLEAIMKWFEERDIRVGIPQEFKEIEFHKNKSQLTKSHNNKSLLSPMLLERRTKINSQIKINLARSW